MDEKLKGMVERIMKRSGAERLFIIKGPLWVGIVRENKGKYVIMAKSGQVFIRDNINDYEVESVVHRSFEGGIVITDAKDYFFRGWRE